MENGNYRDLTDKEIEILISRNCSAEHWDDIKVSDDFDIRFVQNVQFSGNIRIGHFDNIFDLAGGIKKHAGLKNVSLHNVKIGNGCCIENVKNYIANYIIGDNVFIDNVDCIVVDGMSSFGNGTEVAVLNETGGREVVIHDNLSVHEAYISAMYRHRPMLAEKLNEMAQQYCKDCASDTGRIGSNAVIVNTGYIKNTKIGEYTKIEGAGKLKNGSINSNANDPVYIGNGVECCDFIISSGSKIDNDSMLTKCFIGQACHIGHGYSATDSLFFSNCQEENGEACSIFAGPFTVTHHKSTLLIAGMFSFMNAGSGSNQSNHMYKLGPIHQGILERGAKTASDSYILWPARIGAFSLVMGRHSTHTDTTDMPFSYLIEKNNTTYLVPGVNLKSVGTIRDAQKWPKRDNRKDVRRLDKINYNLLSPYTIQKMINGKGILENLEKISGENSDSFSYQSAKINNSALKKGIEYYRIGIDKFLGNSIIKRLENIRFSSNQEIRERLKPDTETGSGEWVDLQGLIAPKSEVNRLIDDIVKGILNTSEKIDHRLQDIHDNYYNYEWTWAYEKIMNIYGLDMNNITADDVVMIVNRWNNAVVKLDNMVYEDAKKEFSLTAMTGFGADGTKEEQKLDFEKVRGDFDNNPFVLAVINHINMKTALGKELIERIRNLCVE